VAYHSRKTQPQVNGIKRIMERNLCRQSWIKVQVIELIWALFCYGFIVPAWCFILAFSWIEFIADGLRSKFSFSYVVKFLCLQKGYKIIYSGVTSKFAHSLVVKPCHYEWTPSCTVLSYVHSILTVCPCKFRVTVVFLPPPPSRWPCSWIFPRQNFIFPQYRCRTVLHKITPLS